MPLKQYKYIIYQVAPNALKAFKANKMTLCFSQKDKIGASDNFLDIDI